MGVNCTHTHTHTFVAITFLFYSRECAGVGGVCSFFRVFKMHTSHSRKKKLFSFFGDGGGSGCVKLETLV